MFFELPWDLNGFSAISQGFYHFVVRNYRVCKSGFKIGFQLFLVVLDFLAQQLIFDLLVGVLDDS